MSNIPPPNDSIMAAFPGLTDLTEFDSGGFKVVYRATVGASTEMFKLVCLPVIGKTDEDSEQRDRYSCVTFLVEDSARTDETVFVDDRVRQVKAHCRVEPDTA